MIIDQRGLQRDWKYTGCLCLFWLVWTPVTCAVAVLLWSDFNWFLMVWLVLACMAVLGIPWMLWRARKPLTLEAREHCLIIRGVVVPFRREVRIPLDQPITLFLGHWINCGEAEGVITLNLFLGKQPGARRVMLAHFVHPSGKQEIFRQIAGFLRRNGYPFTAEGGPAEA